MNKKVVILLTTIIIISVCILFTLIGCNVNTECVHEWQDGDVISSATCTDGGSKEQICTKCGDKQSVEVPALGHSFSTDWTTDDNEHWHICTRDNCTAKQSEADHADTNKDHKCDICDVVISEHEGGTATCHQKAVCSICGEAYGEFDSANHTGETVWSTKNTTKHEKTYNCCDAVVVSIEDHEWSNGTCSECGYICTHEGGNATCLEKATCSVCGEAYGDLADHVYNKQTADDKYLVSVATCAAKASYYYSCSICDKSENNPEHVFESGEVDSANHIGREEWIAIDEYNHKEWWSCCGLILVESEAHEINESGVCSKCGIGCKHVSTIHHEYKSASCTELGNIEYWECNDCGSRFGDSACTGAISGSVVIDAPGHSPAKTEATVATCISQGNIEYWYCSSCASYFTDEYCTTELSDRNGDGLVNKEDTVISKDLTNHDYSDEWSSVLDGHYHECNREGCGQHDTLIPHDWTNNNGKCKDCQYTCLHTNQTLVSLDGSYHQNKCDVCHIYLGEKGNHSLNEQGHCDCGYGCTHSALTHVEAKAVNCTENGNDEYYYCSTCDRYFSDEACQIPFKGNKEIKAYGHSIVLDTLQGNNGYSWSDNSSSCTAYGKCNNAGCSYTTTAIATISSEITQDKSCTLPELTKYTATFDEVWADTQIKSNVQTETALGHTYGAVSYYTTYKDFNNYTNEGHEVYATHTCTVCSESESVKASDVYVYSVYIYCEKDGAIDYYVEFDEQYTWAQTNGEMTHIVVKALGHNMKPVEAQAPTCTEVGWDAYEQCSRYRCDYNTKGADIPMVSHTCGDWNEEKPATCVDKGVKGHKDCTVCNNHIDQDGNIIDDLEIAVNPNNHDILNHSAKAPTCTEIGWDAYDTCQREGCSYSTYSEKPALDHDYSDQLSYDVDGHWYACKHEGCIEKKDEASHVCEANSHNCTICSYVSDHNDDNNDHSCDICGTVTSECADNDSDHLCDICKVKLSDCKFVDGLCKTCGAGDTSGNENLTFEKIEDNGQYYYSVKKYSGNGDEEVIIPWYQYDDENGKYYPVKAISYQAFYNVQGAGMTVVLQGVESIGEQAFQSCSALTSISITDRVKSIGVSAFSQCTNLASVSLGNGLISIGERAFNECSLLTTITLPNSIESIGSYAFYSCKKLESVNIPSKVSAIETSTFSNCSALVNVSFSEGVTSIGSNAFYRCEALTQITLPKSLTQIGNNAFYQCKKLSSIVIPDGVTSIGDLAFWNCNQLESVEFGANLEKLGNNAFRYCSSLKSVSLPSKLTSIEEYTFQDCSGLESIVFSDSITSIGSYCMSGCSSLLDVTIGKGVTKIYSSAFNNCNALNNVYISDLSAWCRVDFSSGNSNPLFIASNLYLNGELVEALTIPEDVESIGEYAFYTYAKLTSADIHSGVKSVGLRAFYNCTSLADVTISDNLTNIGLDAFTGTPWSESLTAQDNGVVYVGKVAYKYEGTMPENTSITFKEGTIGIADDLFKGCADLVEVKIPSSVTSIGANSFYNCTGLTSISIPSSVTSIGAYAFYGCASLKTLNLSTNLVSVGRQAFVSCGSLETVNIPDFASWYAIDFADNSSVPLSNENARLYVNGVSPSGNIEISDVGIIPAYTFRNCVDLTGVTIGEGVQTIGFGAFYGCNKLSSVTISTDVTTIDSNAFYGCTALSSIEIPSSVTAINSSTFKGCTGLTSFEIPSSVTSIGSSAFSGCSGLTTIEIPSSVTSIGSSVFYNCTGLTSIEIPSSVTTIGISAFSGCTALTSIVIPDSVTSINGSIFAGCTGLTSVKLPENIKSITASMFYNCTSLSEVIFGEEITSIDGNVFYGCTALTSIVIPEGVKSLGNSVFEKCTALSSVTIPSSVTSIGSSAFSGCTALTSIILPSELTTIKSRTFYGCINLKTIVIPDNVATIEYGVFNGCSTLYSVTIGSSLSTIGNEAFKDCVRLVEIINNSKSLTLTKGSTNNGYVAYYAINIVNDNSGSSSNIDNNGFVVLEEGDNTILVGYEGTETELTIPEGVNEIGNYALAGNTSLTKVVIPSSVTKIGNYAFSNCTSLLEVNIPDGVTNIGKYAFEYCSGLSEITIPPSVQIINMGAFYYCSNLATVNWNATGVDTTSKYTYIFSNNTNLTVVNFGDDVIVIPKSLFYGVKTLTTVNMGKNITEISINAFESCTNLANITWSEKIEKIGEKAFYNCTSLTNVTIGANVATFGSNAFANCSALTTVYWNSTKCSKVPTSSNALFVDCTSLSTVVFGDGVTSIPASLFNGCSALSKAIIPSSVQTIGASVFSDTSISAIYISDLSVWCKIEFGSSPLNSPTSASMVNLYLNDVIITDLVIPDDVTSISNYAFYGAQGVTSLTIGKNVTSIGRISFNYCRGLTTVNWNAISCTSGEYSTPIFSGCSNLATVNIGEDVKELGSYIFSGCSGITTVNWNAIALQESIRSPFTGCNNLNTVRIGDKVTSIPEDAFYNVSNLKNVYISASVQSIGKNAFYGCYTMSDENIREGIEKVYITDLSAWFKIDLLNSNSVPFISNTELYLNGTLLEDLVIPEDVEVIKAYAMYNCDSLKSITISSNVTEIGEYAFSGCDNVKVVTIGENVAKIGYNAFSSNTELVTVNWNATECKTSDDSNYYIFSTCDKITTINIGDNVTIIPRRAFCYLSNVMSITIPANVTKIDFEAFKGCYRLVEIYNKSSLSLKKGYYDNGYVAYYAMEIYTEEYVSKISTDENGYVIYTDGENKILVGYSGTETDLVIPSGITAINGYALYRTNATSVTIPNSVTSIGEGAFYYLSKLTALTIPDSVTSIGKSAFYYCSQLSSITLSRNVTIIDELTFAGCSALTSIELHDGITSIRDKAFSNSGLTSITIPDSVTSLGTYVFANCSSLISVTINAKITEIPMGTFYYCTNLTDIVIPSTVTEIAYNAFSYCKNLTSIVIPSSVTYVDYYVFQGCDSLTSVTFEDAENWYYTKNASEALNRSDGTQVNLENASNNATNLTSTYVNYYWFKKLSSESDT